MFNREISGKLKEYIKQYKAVALVGPRQSGKTTLSKAVFSDFDYVSLENPDTRSRATEDPRSFLSSLHNNTILDEVQNTPHLFSYLQEIIDNKDDLRRFVLTGSNSFLLNEKISQSLAGRIRITSILPLLQSELTEKVQKKNIDEILWFGSYPAIFDRIINPRDWYADYYQTYIQKDVRSTLNIKDLDLFDRFIRICAGRSGQLVNFNSISEDIGISQPTAKEWVSVLQSSFITLKLQPHFKNFNKQIIKTPKLYFYDTGLLCFLLKIRTPEQLSTHPLRGNIFETFVISEIIKTYYSKAMEHPLYFWRDKQGHEIDLIIDKGSHLYPIEIKSGQTFHDSWLKNLTWFNKLQAQEESSLIYGGAKSFNHKNTQIISATRFAEKRFLSAIDPL